jgi:DNA-binding CsgD family transcriptional regulator/pimeloyl-ACP methyl ester carboxylesterase
MFDGRPAPAFIGAWTALNDDDAAWKDLIDEIAETAARLHPSVGTATSVHPDAVACALVDRRGRIRRADARFIDWIGDPETLPSCERLTTLACRAGRSIGLVTAADGRVFSLFAVRRDLAGPWSVVAGEMPASCEPRDQVLLIAFAPSNCSVLIARAAAAIGLSPLEARLAEALLDAPSLKVAAESVGVGRETAKDALASAMRKAGVASASQFVGRIVDLSCEDVGSQGSDLELLRQAMDLSPAEARVAVAIVAGGTAKEIGDTLGLTALTVKSYRRSVFQKTGVNRSRDLQRLISEVGELGRLASASEVLADEGKVQERLRVVARDGRHIAVIDYGPASGVPLVVGHGFTTGRLMGGRLLDRCRAAGFRVLIPQRPGFGLTDAARTDYLDTAADDLAGVLDSLAIERTRVLTRDGGVASLLAFDVRHPGRLDRPVLLNPRAPLGARRAPLAPMSAISRILLDRPGLIEPFAEMLRRQTRGDILEGMLRRACTIDIDREALERPGVLPQLVRDMQGLVSRSVRGFIDEQLVYSRGWTPPAVLARGWSVAYSGAMWGDPDSTPWSDLPDLRRVVIEGAGLLAVFTHTDEVLQLLA